MATGPSGALQSAPFPHENGTRAPRAPKGPATGALGPQVGPPRRGPLGDRARGSAADTCPDCHAPVLKRRWLGLWITLEPLALDDHGEYLAIRDGIKTWNTWPDGVTEPRGLTQVRYRQLTARHATHRCSQSYGTVPPPPARTPADLPDNPPF